MKTRNPGPDDIERDVRLALAEDVGAGDLTAALVPAGTAASAVVVARENAVLCGTAWFDEVFRQLDDTVKVQWHSRDGERIDENRIICSIEGPSRAILSGERTALNFLQTLSGTATVTRHLVEILDGLETRILDTRKTLPGLRAAQKYAVLCGGGNNHRMGLYDAILIKENHILAAGGIRQAIAAARQQDVPVEIEVETLDQLREALDAGIQSVLLDNFSIDEMCEAVKVNKSINHGTATLEASGGVDEQTLRAIAETGVDYISIGALTKHVRAIDFSMRFDT